MNIKTQKDLKQRERKHRNKKCLQIVNIIWDTTRNRRFNDVDTYQETHERDQTTETERTQYSSDNNEANVEKERNVNDLNSLALVESKDARKTRRKRHRWVEWLKNDRDHRCAKSLTNDKHERSKNKEATMSERIELRILQYNVNKSRKNVMISLLQKKNIVNYDVLMIQKSWRDTKNAHAYNSCNIDFTLINNEDKLCFLINKRINNNNWTTT